MILTSLPFLYQNNKKDQARKLIYDRLSNTTLYPGRGEITEFFNKMIFVSPIGEGRPKFSDTKDRIMYPTDLYNVFDIPAQEELLYTVGLFQGWEDIPNSQDKYIQFIDPATNLNKKQRVAFEVSHLFKENPTSITIEYITINSVNNVQNKLLQPEDSILIHLGFEKTKTIFKKGDAIILLPVFDPPDLSKKDEYGNYLVSHLIVRRLAGSNL